jgi:RND family efflux transporter MFP subunit
MLRLLMLAVLAQIAMTTVAEDAVPVRVSLLSTLALQPTRTAPATVVSNNEVEISAEIAARVVEIPPRIGDVLEKGAVIGRLDCRDYELELARARADLDVLRARLEFARRRLARAEELAARQSLAIEVLDEREAERTVLVAEIAGNEARIAQATVAVSRCTITSPFRALVRERRAPPGQYVKAGDVVARVVDVADLELTAEVQLADVAAVAENPEPTFVTGDERYPVRLRVAVAAIDTATRSQELRFTFTAARPLTGSAGQLSWIDTRPHVPGLALIRRGDELGLFLVVDGHARFVVVPGAQAGRASAVALPGDSLVVIEGHYGLTDGQAVRLLAD